MGRYPPKMPKQLASFNFLLQEERYRCTDHPIPAYQQHGLLARGDDRDDVTGTEAVKPEHHLLSNSDANIPEVAREEVSSHWSEALSASFDPKRTSGSTSAFIT